MISILDTYIMNVYWFPHDWLAKNSSGYLQLNLPTLLFFFYWPHTIVNFLVNLFAKEGFGFSPVPLLSLFFCSFCLCHFSFALILIDLKHVMVSAAITERRMRSGKNTLYAKKRREMACEYLNVVYILANLFALPELPTRAI